jgi:hypothetical protein
MMTRRTKAHRGRPQHLRFVGLASISADRLSTGVKPSAGNGHRESPRLCRRLSLGAARTGGGKEARISEMEPECRWDAEHG